MSLLALPDELQARVCAWLSLYNTVLFRALCKATRRVFAEHVNQDAALWVNKVTSSNLVWTANEWFVRSLAEKKATLMQAASLFKLVPTLPMQPPLALFAAVKCADGGSTLALASTLFASRTWDGGYWDVSMQLRFCVEREKVVQHYEPPSTSGPRDAAGDRWVVSVAVELYIFCADSGMRLLGRTALKPPAYCEFGMLMPYGLHEYEDDSDSRGGWIGVNPEELYVHISDDLDIPNFDPEEYDNADAQRRVQQLDISDVLQRKGVKAYFAKFYAAKA